MRDHTSVSALHKLSSITAKSRTGSTSSYHPKRKTPISIIHKQNQKPQRTAAATVWLDNSATISSGSNPASLNRSMIASTESVGSGTVRSGAASVGGGLPKKKSSWGAPGQFAVPTAAARWTKSPAERFVVWKTGNCSEVMSSILGVGVGGAVRLVGEYVIGQRISEQPRWDLPDVGV